MPNQDVPAVTTNPGGATSVLITRELSLHSQGRMKGRPAGPVISKKMTVAANTKGFLISLQIAQAAILMLITDNLTITGSRTA